MISPLANLIISSLVFIETCISKIDFKTFNANSIVTPRDRSETLLLENVRWLSTPTVKPIVSIWLLFTPVTNPSLGVC